MDKLIVPLIIVHASLGGLALLIGTCTLFFKKGSKLHIKSGKFFFWALLLSALLSLIVSGSASNRSIFLLLIGLFTIYFLLAGMRSIQFKKEALNLTFDYIYSGLMLLVSILMISYPFFFQHGIKPVVLALGILGFSFSLKDFFNYRNPDKLRLNYITLHLSRMMAAYISAFTAFIVVNQVFPGIYNWFIPGIIGGFVISYWTRKYRRKSNSKLTKTQ